MITDKLNTVKIKRLHDKIYNVSHYDHWRILSHVSKFPGKTVTELWTWLGMRQDRFSFCLSHLVDAKLIRKKKEGKWHRIYLCSDGFEKFANDVSRIAELYNSK